MTPNVWIEWLGLLPRTKVSRVHEPCVPITVCPLYRKSLSAGHTATAKVVTYTVQDTPHAIHVANLPFKLGYQLKLDYNRLFPLPYIIRRYTV